MGLVRGVCTMRIVTLLVIYPLLSVLVAVAIFKFIWKLKLLV